MMKINYVYGTSFSMLVVITNMMIKKFVRNMTKKIGYGIRTQMHSRMMLNIFFGTFINTGLIILVPQANFRYAPEPFKWIPVRNNLTDFGKYWYHELPDELIKTMLITAFIPWIEFVSKLVIKRLKIWMDKKGEFPTKCQSNQQYMNLYASGGYRLYNQYSLILHHIAITFLYGMILPVLFPITLLAITNIYITDRLLLAYHF